jgi:hypothetical protein
MLLEVPLDEFMAWEKDETVVDGVTRKKRFKTARQQAKPVNFGVPGGLGVASLIAYAHTTYGVDLSPEQARGFREKLITEVYPELSAYLADDSHAIVSANLGASLEEVRQALGDIHPTSIRKVLTGNPLTREGEPYKPHFENRIWTALTNLARDPELKAAFEQRAASKELADRVCFSKVTTLTGRIRGRVRYSQARNTPFQGLAADGAALALFALVKEGWRVVAHIHDENLFELPARPAMSRRPTSGGSWSSCAGRWPRCCLATSR